MMDLPKVTFRDLVEDGSIRQLDVDMSVEWFLKNEFTVRYSNENGLSRQLRSELPPLMQLPRDLRLAVQQALLDSEPNGWREGWARAWCILSKGTTRDEIIGLAEAEFVSEIFLRRYLAIKGLLKVES